MGIAKQVGAQLGGQQRAGEVLVDDRLDAGEVAVGVAHDGDAAAAAGDDDRRRPRAARGSSRSSTISTGRGGGHDAPPAAPGVLGHVPAQPLGVLVRGRVVEERADGLGRVGERRVGRVDDGLRHDRHDPPVDAPAAQLVADRLEEHVADRALGVADGVVHRDRRHLGLRQLRAAQDEADLRPVAVGDDEPPALLHELDERAGDRAHRLVLVGDRLVLGVGDQRVAAQRDDGDRAHAAAASAPATASIAARKHCQRRGRDAGADLADAGLAVRDAGVDDRQDAGVDARGARRCRHAVAPKFSAGSVKAGCVPSVIDRMRRLFSVASAGVPPTNCTIAGAAAIAKPPTPAVSVIALSPRSAAASSTP